MIVAPLIVAAAIVLGAFLISERIRHMADPLQAPFASIVASLASIVSGLTTIANNLANNPNVPPSDVTQAQGFATQLGAIDTQIQALATQTGGSGGTGGLQVTSISPTGGPVAGGTTVVVTGSGFTGATAVGFGTLAAASFSVTSDTSVSCVSPPDAAGTVDITVTTPAGTSAVNAGDKYTYS